MHKYNGLRPATDGFVSSVTEDNDYGAERYGCSSRRCSRKPRMRRAAVNDDWGSCGAGICEPLVARFAKPFCAAHFPLAATLLVIVAKSLRCAAGCSITTLLVLENRGVFRRKQSTAVWSWSRRRGGLLGSAAEGHGQQRIEAQNARMASRALHTRTGGLRGFSS